MLQSGLVSVISPCFNVARYLPYYFESLLIQTYKKLEIILVNDGSTDNTDQVIKAWLPKLECAGYLTKYIVKDNGGQSSAINQALSHFTGEFLTWPDSDDFLYPDSIKKRVEFLTKNTEFGIVRTAADIYHENDRTKMVGLLNTNNTIVNDKDFFEDLVFTNTYFAPICYMVRSSYFLLTNPSRSIYVRKDAGQNWQMLLPLAAKYACGYLPESLCGYLIRENSHSHSNNTLDSSLNYYIMCLDVLNNTLKSMGSNYSAMEKELDIHYSIKRYHLGVDFKNCKLVFKELQYLEQMHGLTTAEKVQKFLCKNTMTFNGVVVPLMQLRQLSRRLIYKLIRR